MSVSIDIFNSFKTTTFGDKALMTTMGILPLERVNVIPSGAPLWSFRGDWCTSEKVGYSADALVELLDDKRVRMECTISQHSNLDHCHL